MAVERNPIRALALAAGRNPIRALAPAAGRNPIRALAPAAGRNPIRALAPAVILLASVAVAACDGDSEPERQATTPPAEPEPEPGTPPTPSPEPSPTPTPVEEDEDEGLGAYAVSAGHEGAVEAGMDVLAEGGNAVDAAIATAYAVSVVEPFASGIGGGGAVIIVEPGEDPVAYDYREVVAADGAIPADNTGIPGFVAGMQTLHEAHGTAELADLLEPAIDLAREGVATPDIVADQLRSAAHRLPTGDLPHLYPQGAALAPGDDLVQDELASTLEHIVDGGAQAFYEGDLAETLADRVDGIDTESLASYEVQREAPVSGAFAGLEVLGAAPPLPGATVVQMLQLAESLGLEGYEPGSADFIHAITTAWRLGEHELRWVMGDSAFVDVPLDDLTDPERNAALAEQASMDTVVDIDPGQRDGGLGGNTTHISVVDDDGAMVSMTNTLTNFWGSGNHELGFFLNDQLRRFDFGAGDANEPEPGKRSVSWSSPMVVLDGEGRPALAAGTPGGRRIPNVLVQVLARWAVHGQSLADAVEAPRFHAEDTALEVEEALPSEVADALAGIGYGGPSQPEPPYYWGSMQALEIDYEAGEVVGAQDPRRDGTWRAERR